MMPNANEALGGVSFIIFPMGTASRATAAVQRSTI